MNEKDDKVEVLPVVMLVERRKQRSQDLSSAEIMAILRKRAADSKAKG
jgi:hypothetical protein